ncbi:hypothetical protein ACT4MC_24275 (plasmid) [Vibrio furnissii]|uniref:MBL fold metallo-hydrolase n=1 Tax=Comamonas testosteroni TaxID=285 RepID=UPI0015FA70DF|nr:MBL fold metallo-hydrolase [Comamonas testosteroni]
MTGTITEIAADIYRISVYVPQADLQFNVFLVRDDEPLLYHTGQKALFTPIFDAVRTLIDPAKLRWIGFSHFESDECGALNLWLDKAPQAVALASPVLARTCIDEFAIRAPRVLEDDALLATGRYTFRHLLTSHLPHGWGASLLFEETQKVLFCSDLLLQRGDPAPFAGDLVSRAVQALEQGQAGPFRDAIPYTTHTKVTFARLAALDPQVLAIMHGASLRGQGARALLDFEQALARVGGPLQ